MRRFIIIVGVLLALPQVAQAYPWMIRHGYTSCAQCHFDPSGGSQVTLYGRATGDLVMRSRYGAPATEEPSQSAGFLWGAVGIPESFDDGNAAVVLGGDVRAMALYKTLAPAGSDRFAAFPMQLDGTLGATLGRVKAAASVGYAKGTGAASATVAGGENGRLISRHHWAGVELGEERLWLARAGRMNMPFGLRIPEHIMWVRQATQTSINDHQQHGAAVAYMGESVRGEVMAIVGNLQASPSSFRERGYSGYLEWALSEHKTFGISSSVTHAATEIGSGLPRWRHAHGVFTRIATSETVAVMAEADVISLTRLGANGSMQAAGMVMIDAEPVQGFHIGPAAETLCTFTEPKGCSLGGWLTAQWFFAPHADLRFDYLFRRVSANNESTLLLQLHTYL